MNRETISHHKNYAPRKKQKIHDDMI